MQYNLFKNGLSWFCSNLKENSWYLIGSSVDYFYADYPISKINDFDILIDSTIYSPNDISNLDDISEFDYWGTVKYINDKIKCDVYRSLINLEGTKVTIDWMFSDTQENVNYKIFENLNLTLQTLKGRISVLRQTVNNKIKSEAQPVARDRLDKYYKKSII